MRKFLIKSALLLLAAGGIFIWLRSDAAVLAGSTALGMDDSQNWLASHTQDPRDFDLLEAAGADFLRVRLPFQDVSPSPGVFSWSFQAEEGYVDYETLFRRLGRRGIHPVVVLEGGPSYANHLYPQQPVNREELLESWANYVAAAAAQFGGQVDYWQVGGTINDPASWGKTLFPDASDPQAPPDAALYGQMLKTTYTILKSVQASDNILMGGLALGSDCAFHPLAYLQALQEANAWYAFDILTIELPALNGAPETAAVDACGYAPVEASSMPAADSLRAISDYALEGGGKPVWVFGLEFTGDTLTNAAVERGTLPEVIESDYLSRASATLLVHGGARRVFWNYTPTGETPGVLALQSFANLNRTAGGKPVGGSGGIPETDSGNMQVVRFSKNGRLSVVAWHTSGGDSTEPAVIPDVQGYDLLAFSADAASMKAKHGIGLKVDAGGDTALMLSERPVLITGRPDDIKQSALALLKDSASQAGDGLNAKLKIWAQAQKVKAADRVGEWVDQQQRSLIAMLRESFNQWLRKSLGLAKG